jgi:acetylornithine deacetylase/succinyl-diaminopimelate desuccinylase-like protein
MRAFVVAFFAVVGCAVARAQLPPHVVPNPVFGLARLLASMKDDDGRVLIPGYCATAKLSKDDLKVLHDAGDDEAALRKRVGIDQNEKVAPSYQESLQYPSLNVRGIAAASIGESVANIIPREAIAELEMRTTKEANGEYLAGLVTEHIRKQGFRLVDGSPSDQDRQQYPKLASLKPSCSAEEAARQPLDSPIRAWVEKALTGAFEDAPNGAVKPVLIRAMGATVPTDEIVGPLGLPFVIVPTVNADNNQHSYDENLRLGNYLSGMRAMLGLLTTPY